MINCHWSGTKSGWDSEEEVTQWPGIGSWKNEETKVDGSLSLSDALMFHASMRNHRGVELRLYILGFVPYVPRTLNVDHKVVKAI